MNSYLKEINENYLIKKATKSEIKGIVKTRELLKSFEKIGVKKNENLKH